MNRRQFFSWLGLAGGLLLLPKRVWGRGRLAPLVRVEGWTVLSMGAPRDGAIQVAMATPSGEAFTVEVLRRDPDFPGVARTRALDLYLCNQGSGTSASKEAHGLGAMALARVLEGRPVPSQLLTLRQRAARFPRYA